MVKQDKERRTMNIPRSTIFEPLSGERGSWKLKSPASKLANDMVIPQVLRRTKRTDAEKIVRYDIDVSGQNNPNIVKSPEREQKVRAKVAESEVPSLSKTNPELEKRFKEVLLEVETLQRVKEDDIRNYQDEVDGLKKHIEELQADNKELSEQLEKAEEEIKTLENDIQKAQEVADKKSKECDELKEEITILHELQYKREDEEDTIKRLDDSLKENERLKEELINLQLNIKVTEDSKDEVKGNNEDMMKETEKLKEEINNLKKEIEAFNNDNANLICANKELKELNEGLTQNITKLEERIKEDENLKADNKVLKAEQEKLREDLYNEMNENENAKKDIDDKAVECELLIDQLKRVMEDKLEGDKKLKATLIENANLRVQNEMLLNEQDPLTDTLKSKYDAKNKAMEGLKGDLADDEKKEVSTEEVKENMKKLEYDKNSKEKEVELLRNEINNLIENKYKEMPTLKDKEVENVNLRIENNILKDQQDQLMKLLNEERGKRKDSESDKEALKEELIKGKPEQDEIGKLKDEIRDLKHKLEQLNRELMNSKEENKDDLYKQILDKDREIGLLSKDLRLNEKAKKKLLNMLKSIKDSKEESETSIVNIISELELELSLPEVEQDIITERSTKKQTEINISTENIERIDDNKFPIYPSLLVLIVSFLLI